MTPSTLDAPEDKTTVIKNRTVIARAWEVCVTTNRQHNDNLGGNEAF